VSQIDKTLLALLLLAATTFGGIVYANAINRIALLEAHAQETTKEARERDAILIAYTLDMRYLRAAVERIEKKLNTIPPLPDPAPLPKFRYQTLPPTLQPPPSIQGP